MKYIKKFERFSPAPAPAKPAPTTTPAPTRPEKPVKPERPAHPGKAPERPTRRRPIETPSTDPGPLAGKKKSEMDVVTKLKEALDKKGQSLSEFVEKNKKSGK